MRQEYAETAERGLGLLQRFVSKYCSSSHAWFGSEGGVSDGSAHHNLGSSAFHILIGFLEKAFSSY
jgi:hypothetical protein